MRRGVINTLMSALLRILESSGFGRFHTLLEAMSSDSARDVFLYHGANADAIDTPEGLKKEFRRLLMRYHPDRPDGDKEAAQEITQAYAVLEHRPAAASSPDTPNGEYPKWANAGYSGGLKANATIRRQNYTDMNFFKKTMWELSGESTQQWSIMQWDGHFFRHSITVYGSRDIFHEMAAAMIIWGSEGGNPYSTNAVFGQMRSDPGTLYVLYYDGEFFDNPPTLEFDSFNANPANDQSFCRNLPETLANLPKNNMISGSPRQIN